LPDTVAGAHTIPMTRIADVGQRFSQRLSDVGPWFSKTRFGKTNGRINGVILISILLLCLWKSFF
jgi:hypothetical protein